MHARVVSGYNAPPCLLWFAALEVWNSVRIHSMNLQRIAWHHVSCPVIQGAPTSTRGSQRKTGGSPLVWAAKVWNFVVKQNCCAVTVFGDISGALGLSGSGLRSGWVSQGGGKVPFLFDHRPFTAQQFLFDHKVRFPQNLADPAALQT